MKFYNVFSGFLTGATREAYIRNIGDRVFNSLHSYWYLKDCDDQKIIDGFAITKGNIMIDSGAFTAYADAKMKRQKENSGRQKPQLDIDKYIEDYINWINKWDSYVTVFGQMDVIPVEARTKQEYDECCQRTWQNYLYMTERMNHPEKLLYTFHFGEPYEWLEKALKHKLPNGKPMEYMAIGGLVGVPTKERRAFLDECFRIISNSEVPNIKVHGFGVSSQKVWKEFPFESCDSFTPGMNANHGFVCSDKGAYREEGYKSIYKPRDEDKKRELNKLLPPKEDPDHVYEADKSEEQLKEEALIRTDEKAKLLIRNIEYWNDLANSIPKAQKTYKKHLL